jgi:hypothetical protein
VFAANASSAEMKAAMMKTASASVRRDNSSNCLSFRGGAATDLEGLHCDESGDCLSFHDGQK